MTIVQNIQNFFCPRIESVGMMTPAATGNHYMVVVTYCTGRQRVRRFRHGRAYDAQAAAKQHYNQMVDKMTRQKKGRTY